MVQNQAVENDKSFHIGSKLVVALASALSLPGYLALLWRVLVYLSDTAYGHYPPAYVLAFWRLFWWLGIAFLAGLLFHPLALLMVFTASAFSIEKRMKWLAWGNVLGGIVAYLIVMFQIRWA